MAGIFSATKELILRTVYKMREATTITAGVRMKREDKKSRKQLNERKSCRSMPSNGEKAVVE